MPWKFFSVHRYHTLDAHGVSVFIFSGSLGVLTCRPKASPTVFADVVFSYLVEWFFSDSQPQKSTKHKWQGSLEWLGFLLKVICYFSVYHTVKVTICPPPLGDHFFWSLFSNHRRVAFFQGMFCKIYGEVIMPPFHTNSFHSGHRWNFKTSRKLLPLLFFLVHIKLYTPGNSAGDLFGMVKWQFQIAKWPSTRGIRRSLWITWHSFICIKLSWWAPLLGVWISIS